MAGLKFLVTITALVTALFLAPASAAEDAGAVATIAGQVFSDVERRVIDAYFHTGDSRDDDYRDREDRDDDGKAKKYKGHGKGKQKGLPPGLARRDSLPPGLQRQLERNGTLPPGLAKRDLPDDLESRLTPPPTGYERVLAEDDLVLIETATGVIADIIYDVIAGR